MSNFDDNDDEFDPDYKVSERMRTVILAEIDLVGEMKAGFTKKLIEEGCDPEVAALAVELFFSNPS